MSFGQGINIKLYSGPREWSDQFYSSTCDQMYIGGQHGGAGKTNCPYIEHKDWGVPGTDTDSVKNLQHGKIDKDYFNKWYKSRPTDPAHKSGQLVSQGLYDSGVSGGLSSVSPGATPSYWNATPDGIGGYASNGYPYNTSGFDSTYGNKGSGANGWDWALQSCRQEYGAYINPDVKCDDPVCQTEKIAQTNPVYFESGCNTELHHSCVTGEIAKAIAVPVGEAIIAVALGVATGGAADAALLSAEVGAEVATEEAAIIAAREAAEIAAKDITKAAMRSAARQGEAEGIEMVDMGAEAVAERVAARTAAEEAAEAAAEKQVEGAACESFMSAGLARSAAMVKQRATTLERALEFGKKAKKIGGAARAASAAKSAMGLAGGAAVGMGISGVAYAINKGENPFVVIKDQAKSLTGSASTIVKTATGAYHDSFGKQYQQCVKNYTEPTVTSEQKEARKQACKSHAATAAMEYMGKHAATVADSQDIGSDLLLAHQYRQYSNYARKVGGLKHLWTLRGNVGKISEGRSNPFTKLKGTTLGGSLKQAIKCNKGSLLATVGEIAGAAMLADSIAHEDCYTCSGNEVQIDNSVANNPFKSGLGIEPEQPYADSADNRHPIPKWHADIVKPYCFIPNRRGAEGYCPIFGDTLAIEEKDPGWVLSNNTDYQKYKGSILGTTDFEMPENRPFWTLNDTQSRVQTGKQGLHNNIEGDTPPDAWGKSSGLEPAFDEDPAHLAITEGGRKWTNYGYVCNYNHTDDFIMNPIQAQNFLDMTIGPINTIDLSVSGMMSNTCAKPLVFKDLQGTQKQTNLGSPETVYSKTSCYFNDGRDNLPIGSPNGAFSSSGTPYADWTLPDKMKYYFSEDIMNRVDVLGQGSYNEHYQANTLPVPSDPNIPYNQSFGYRSPGDMRLGGDDPFALLPDPNPMFTGSLPWFQKGKNDYTFDNYQTDFDANYTNYKLPATFWYEHDTFNKVMADYCIRKGPKIDHPKDGKNYSWETATAAAGNCLLQGGIGSNAAPGLPSSPNSVRTYCPNMFLKEAGLQPQSPTSDPARDLCYNCSKAEIETTGEVPRPTDVCGRWYKGMIDSYKNLSSITKLNPTQIFKEYNKAVDEYCNIPEHRDLVECSCHNADNANNPTEFNKYFQLWSSFENSTMGTKGMKYCWLTPCVPTEGGFNGFEGEDIINFKDPASYVNSSRQEPGSPWIGKCPEMSCEEFLLYTDNTHLTDDHINSGIKACGGDTVSNEGYICSHDAAGNPKCISSGRYVSNTDPEYSMTKSSCEKKCLGKGPARATCAQKYWRCKNGKLIPTYDGEYTQFWSGSGECDEYIPRTAPPGSAPAVINVSSPSDFDRESDKCEAEPFIPDEGGAEESDKRALVIFIILIVALLMITLAYVFLIRPYKKLKTSKVKSTTNI